MLQARVVVREPLLEFFEDRKLLRAHEENLTDTDYLSIGDSAGFPSVSPTAALGGGSDFADIGMRPRGL